MAFKTYAKKEDVPAALLEHYVEKDGKWVPQMDGATGDDGADRGKLAEMRQANIDQAKELAALKTQLGRFGSLDPAKATEAMATLRQMAEDQELSALLGDKPDAKTVKAAAAKLAETMAKAQITERDAQIAALNTAKATTEKVNADMRGRLAGTLLDSALNNAISTKGLKLARGAAAVLSKVAQDHWEIGDDFSLKSKGLFDKEAKAIASVDDYVPILVKSHPFLFESAGGGGAGGPGLGAGQQGPKGVSADPLTPGQLSLSAKAT